MKESSFECNYRNPSNDSLEFDSNTHKKKILLATTGSVATIKLLNIIDLFLQNSSIDLKLIVTKSSLPFLDLQNINQRGVKLYHDDDEWDYWNQDECHRNSVLHIELRKWADTLLIAPLSANTLAKLASGMCDNLLTCVTRAWDPAKPIFIAPAMNTFMWNHPLTAQNLSVINSFGFYKIIDPIYKTLACRDTGIGAMAEPETCFKKVMAYFDTLDQIFPENLEEKQYLDLLQDIMAHGEHRSDRTGTGTLAIFAPNRLKFSLRNNKFPLLTTKRTFFKGIVYELLWFIKGDTNSKHLADLGIHVWDGNGSREFLDSQGLTDRQEGDLGPVYGFQWRHFGAEYMDCNSDYRGKGVDQIQDIINQIKTNPSSRRIILSAWNPADLKKMALPPCHVLCQFYVSSNKELSCILYQRSCDMGLGIPFNIASYSLLTIIIASICGLKPGDFFIMMGDCHIYKNHVEALQQQCTRRPREFPTLHIKRKVENFEDFTFEDFSLQDYNPYPSIKMKMSV